MAKPQLPTDTSRRRLVKGLAVAAAGGGIVLLFGSNFVLNAKQTPAGTGLVRASASAGSDKSTAEVQTTFSRIKVRYIQMSDVISGVDQEYYVLPNPANFNQLLTVVCSAHPILSGMMPNMVVLVDGLAAKTDSRLKDGDEVDIFPMMAGG